MTMIKPAILRRARDLWVDVDQAAGRADFTNNLNDLQAQLSLALVIERAEGKLIDSKRRDVRQDHAILYLQARLADFFTRIALIDWLWERARAAEHDFAYLGFRGLAIKDIHIDIVGVMDAVAPIAIQTTGRVHWAGKQLPGYSDLTSPKSHYRKQLPRDVSELVDESLRWWSHVVEVRNVLTHRDHQKIVFGRSSERRRFQVFEPGFSPLILDPELLAEEGDRIVDLDRYIAFVWAEMNVFLHGLGELVAQHLNVEITGQSTWGTNATFLVSEIDGLLEEGKATA